MNDQTPQDDNIFNDDLFEREKFIGEVTPIIGQLVKIGGAIAIDAGFGMGKTWLCDKYLEYLTKSGYKSAKIDVFLHDYADDPFIPIHQAIANILGKEDTSLLKKVGKEILKTSASYALKQIPVIGRSAIKISNIILDEMLDSSNSLERKIENYKIALKELAKNTQIVIFIDELDRCRPSYALLVLERIKHYFDIPNILFVLMINSDQLISVIKHTYGHSEEQARAYLEKFWIYPPIGLPNISSTELRAGKSNQVFNKNFALKHYKYLFDSSKYSKLFDIGEKEKFSQKYSDYIECLFKISQCMGLNYREHIQVVIKASIYKRTYLSEYCVFNAYLIVLSTKYHEIIQGIKGGEVEAHHKARDLLIKMNNPIDALYIDGLIKLHECVTSENIISDEVRNRLAFFHMECLLIFDDSTFIAGEKVNKALSSYTTHIFSSESMEPI